MHQPNLYPIEQRIVQVLQHLDLEQAHFAGRVPDDWLGLVNQHPEVIASLTLVCTRMAPPELATLGDRLLVFNGDQPLVGEIMLRARSHLPAAHYVVLPGYATAPWTDITRERAGELTTAFTALLGRKSSGKRIKASSTIHTVMWRNSCRIWCWHNSAPRKRRNISAAWRKPLLRRPSLSPGHITVWLG